MSTNFSLIWVSGIVLKFKVMWRDLIVVSFRPNSVRENNLKYTKYVFLRKLSKDTKKKQLFIKIIGNLSAVDLACSFFSVRYSTVKLILITVYLSVNDDANY